MNILTSAIRRILVRNTDKVISTTGRNMLIGMGDYSPNLPSVKRLIVKILLFSLIFFCIIKFFLIIGAPMLAEVTPLFFIGNIITLFVKKNIFGRQQVPIELADRRYKSGTRTVGYKFIKDAANKINFTPAQIKLSKMEGILKTILIFLIIIIVNPSTRLSTNKARQLSTTEILNLLKLNDTLVAKQEDANTIFFIKLKDKQAHSKKYNKSYFKEVFTDSAKLLGQFIKIDSSGSTADSTFFIAINPFHILDTGFNLSAKQKRIDNLFYIRSIDGTVTSYNLNK